jgi:hypothetical protein
MLLTDSGNIKSTADTTMTWKLDGLIPLFGGVVLKTPSANFSYADRTTMGRNVAGGHPLVVRPSYTLLSKLSNALETSPNW